MGREAVALGVAWGGERRVGGGEKEGAEKGEDEYEGRE